MHELLSLVRVSGDEAEIGEEPIALGPVEELEARGVVFPLGPSHLVVLGITCIELHPRSPLASG